MIRAVTSEGCMQGKTLLTGVHYISGKPVPPEYTPDFSSLRGIYGLLAVMNTDDMWAAYDQLSVKSVDPSPVLKKNVPKKSNFRVIN